VDVYKTEALPHTSGEAPLYFTHRKKLTIKADVLTQSTSIKRKNFRKGMANSNSCIIFVAIKIKENSSLDEDIR
jgi:hypothetical protein